MDESKAGLRLTQKSYIINPKEERDARTLINSSREWATLIEIINTIRETLKPFFITKGKHILRDLIKIIIKSGATLAVTYNKQSNNVIAIEYLEHFHRYTRPIRAFRLLILDNHNSHATFQFRKLAHKYKIILLYLPAHITHKLQLLNINIFEPQSYFYTKFVE